VLVANYPTLNEVFLGRTTTRPLWFPQGGAYGKLMVYPVIVQVKFPAAWVMVESEQDAEPPGSAYCVSS
jgi:hypothetical protein